MAKKITTLSNFTSGGTAFNLSNSAGLTVTGTVKDTGGTITLTTTAGNLNVNGTLTAVTDSLVSAAKITEGTPGSVTATKILNVTANTGINLGSTHNHIKKVGTRKTNSGPNVIAGIGM